MATLCLVKLLQAPDERIGGKQMNLNLTFTKEEKLIHSSLGCNACFRFLKGGKVDKISILMSGKLLYKNLIIIIIP